MLYKIIMAILRPFVCFFMQIHSKGRENLPDNGAVLICSNHISVLDFLVLLCVFRRRISFMAKAEMFKVPVWNSIAKHFGAFSVDRGKGDVGAVKTAISKLRDGDAVGVFIQGKRRRGERIEDTEPKAGISLIQDKTSCQVLPVSLTTRKMQVKLFRSIYVNVGAVISPEELYVPEGENAHKYKTDTVFGRIMELSRDDFGGKRHF